MHHKSRSLTFFNHIFWHKTDWLTQEGTSGSHFGLKNQKRGQFQFFCVFFVQKVLVLRLFQRARHAVDLSTPKRETTGLEKNCGS
jgi:hypothetical protein